MDTQPGAPPFSLDHVTTAVDYSGFANAPSYGAHHAFQPGITPRPTGVYQTQQPDEDLVHNLKHGHVWISYNPSLITDADRLAIEQLVIDGGTDTGVIVTPRSKNTSTIVVTSLTRQLTLDTFDATLIRNFINTNRGHSPEGFIPSGQRTNTSETLDDSLPQQGTSFSLASLVTEGDVWQFFAAEPYVHEAFHFALSDGLAESNAPLLVVLSKIRSCDVFANYVQQGFNLETVRFAPGIRVRLRVYHCTAMWH